MIRRIAGAVMIIAAFVYSGLSIIKASREHVMALKELRTALGLMYAELGTRLSPIFEIASRLSSADGKYAPAFFQSIKEQMYRIGETSFSDIWKSAAEEAFSCFDKDEKTELCKLGSVLGTYELSDQLNVIDLCRKSIDKCLEDAEKDLSDKERTCIGICSVLGVMIAVVFI